MNRNERRKAINLAGKKIVGGMAPDNADPFVLVALARELKAQIDGAKRSRNVDRAVQYFYKSVEGMIAKAGAVSIACGAGCSHCCNSWVSVNGLEALYIARLVRQKGPEAVEKVRLAHEATKTFAYDERDSHPTACPHLSNNTCSIYLQRPFPCRIAASSDAELCRRHYLEISGESIPAPPLYQRGGSAYAIAMGIALKAAGLPDTVYEFNGALYRALTRDNAEAEWLAGEDVFAGVLTDPNRTLDNPHNQALYELAFA